MRATGSARAALAALTVAGLALGAGVGCSERPARPSSPAAGRHPPARYVALGDEVSTGAGTAEPLRDAWTQRLFRDRLPVGSTFVNLASRGATVSDVLASQVDEAVALAPTLVTIFLPGDVRRGVAPTDYEARLREIVQRLRQAGRVTVLIGNLPPVDEPATSVDAYDAAIGRVASTEGAVAADVHGAFLAERAAGPGDRLGDVTEPTELGHRVVEQAFARALAAASTSRRA